MDCGAAMNQATSFTIIAAYEAKIDQERERRIHAALKRHKVRFGRGVDFDLQELKWTRMSSGICTELVISIPGEEVHGRTRRGDPQERARRLASDLRTCGMFVTIWNGAEEVPSGHHRSGTNE
jgi:hypothetical protein